MWLAMPKSDQHDEADAFGAPQTGIAEGEKIERDHHQRLENVRHQLRGEPRHARQHAESKDDRECACRRIAGAEPRPFMGAQGQRDDPDHDRGLHDDVEPEPRRNAGREERAVKGRAPQ